jgi:hypothetical protein
MLATMKTISTLLILVTVIFAAAHNTTAIVFQPQAKPKTGDSIRLERTACFGTCPIYAVTITAEGTVSFQGQRFTRLQSGTGKISRRAFRKLVREFERIKYFSLPDDFTPGTKNCPQMITDMPSANTSIQLNGKSKTVSHYYGCGNSGVLAKLTALENKIDQVAGTQKWIK